MIYKLLALRGSDDPELKARDEDRKLSAMTWAASRSFEAGDLRAAILAYRTVLRAFPMIPSRSSCQSRSKIGYPVRLLRLAGWPTMALEQDAKALPTCARPSKGHAEQQATG